jgi:hypothetical protein
MLYPRLPYCIHREDRQIYLFLQHWHVTGQVSSLQQHHRLYRNIITYASVFALVQATISVTTPESNNNEGTLRIFFVTDPSIQGGHYSRHHSRPKYRRY